MLHHIKIGYLLRNEDGHTTSLHSARGMMEHLTAGSALENNPYVIAEALDHGGLLLFDRSRPDEGTAHYVLDMPRDGRLTPVDWTAAKRLAQVTLALRLPVNAANFPCIENIGGAQPELSMVVGTDPATFQETALRKLAVFSQPSAQSIGLAGGTRIEDLARQLAELAHKRVAAELQPMEAQGYRVALAPEAAPDGSCSITLTRPATPGAWDAQVVINFDDDIDRGEFLGENFPEFFAGWRLDEADLDSLADSPRMTA